MRSQDTQGKCWRKDERTETCTPKSPILKQVQQKRILANTVNQSQMPQSEADDPLASYPGLHSL